MSLVSVEHQAAFALLAAGTKSFNHSGVRACSQLIGALRLTELLIKSVDEVMAVIVAGRNSRPRG